MSHLVPLVDENDNIIGSKYRDEITPTDIIRAAGLWITNSKGHILLARRSPHKKVDPNRWGSAAVGTVENDESYEITVLREMEEELGLEGVTPTPVKKILMSGYHPHFTQWFSSVVNKEIDEFTLQEEEVAEIHWFTPDEVIKLLKEQPETFVSNIFDWIGLFLSIEC